MKVTPVNNNVTRNKNNGLKAAVHGGMITAGVLGASEGLSWLFNSQAMKKTVAECGGKAKYIAGFAKLIALYTIIGSVANAVMYRITKNMVTKKPPKAVN